MKKNSLITEILRSASFDKVTTGLRVYIERLSCSDVDKLDRLLLLPLLVYLSEKEKININARLQKKLIAVKLTSIFLSANRLSFLKDLQETGLEPYLLKGGAIFLKEYPDEYIRLMGDLDILVPHDSLYEYHNRLLSWGFVQESDHTDQYYDNHHHLKPYHNYDSNLWVEIHHHIFPRNRLSGSLEVFKPEYFFKNKEHVESCGLSYYRPGLELNMLHTMVHWIEEFRVKDSAAQLLDVIYMIQNGSPSWERFLLLLDNKIANTHAYIVLSYLQQNDIIAIDTKYWEQITDKKRIVNNIEMYLLLGIIKLIQEKEGSIYGTLGESNLSIIWFGILDGRSVCMKYLMIIRGILFPADCSGRFSFVFQFRRIRNMVNRLL